MTFVITTGNVEDHLKLSKARDFDDIVITDDGEIFSLHTSNGLTIEQLQEIVDLAKKLREGNHE